MVGASTGPGRAQNFEGALFMRERLERFGLSNRSLNQLAVYLEMLLETNKKFNLTAITDWKEAVEVHIKDALFAVHMADFGKLNGLIDVGSGGGIPGLVLKIAYPRIKCVLIEVNKKKAQFLRDVVAMLELENVEVVELDWRNFLRNTDYDLDLVTARASLTSDELVRMFAPASPYKDKKLLYWASRAWKPSQKTRPYVVKDFAYMIDARQRKLVLMEAAPSTRSSITS